VENERDHPEGGPGPGGLEDGVTDPLSGRAAAGDPPDDPSEGLFGDEAEDFPPGASTALPPKVESWRKRSAVGAILTGFALGLQEALEKQKEDPSIVMETSGDPPRDLPVEADFEYGRPKQSVVQIRPWLLPDGGTEASTERQGSGRPAPDPGNRPRAQAGDAPAPDEGDQNPEGQA
jgi:hypothetical protein